jgi:hypothetical protein
MFKKGDEQEYTFSKSLFQSQTLSATFKFPRLTQRGYSIEGSFMGVLRYILIGSLYAL